MLKRGATSYRLKDFPRRSGKGDKSFGGGTWCQKLVELNDPGLFSPFERGRKRRPAWPGGRKGFTQDRGEGNRDLRMGREFSLPLYRPGGKGGKTDSDKERRTKGTYHHLRKIPLEGSSACPWSNNCPLSEVHLKKRFGRGE